MPIGTGVPTNDTGVVDVPFFKRRKKSENEATLKFLAARRQVDQALDNMASVLNSVQVQADIAKEELDERRSD
jgi:hypothetical protein